MVILTLLIYTFSSVNLNITPSIGGIFAAYIVSTIFNFFYIFGGDKLNTPTQSCICHWFCIKGCSIVVTIISLFMVALFVSLCIIILPTVIFIYYSATSLKSKFLNFWDYDVLCEVSLELKVTKRPNLVRM